jgi:glucokinase
VPNATTQHVLVYDVGGSHISAALCSSSTYELHGLTRAPLPPDVSAASFGRLIHALGETAAKAAGIPHADVAGACLAMPGPFDYTLGISHMQHKLPSLLNIDLKSNLAARFAWQPSQIRFLNDAAAFLLGEVGAGAAKGYPRAIGLTLGTGIGSAFAQDGHILLSGPGIPPGGEIWNIPYQGGIVEDFVSTRYLRQHYQALTGLEAEVSAIAETAKGNQPCPEVLPEIAPPVTPYEAHCRARQAFTDFGRNIGEVLNHILKTDTTSDQAPPFFPEVVVLGGGIARASQLFLPAIRKALAGTNQAPPVLAISTLQDQAPLAGAGVHYFTANN